MFYLVTTNEKMDSNRLYQLPVYGGYSERPTAAWISVH